MRVHPNISETYDSEYGVGAWDRLPEGFKGDYVRFADAYRKLVINKQGEKLEFVPVHNVNVGDRIQVILEDGTIVLGEVSETRIGEIVIGSITVNVDDLKPDPFSGRRRVRMMRRAVVAPKVELGNVIDVWHLRGDMVLSKPVTAVCDGTYYVLYGGGFSGETVTVKDILKWEARNV